MKRTPKVIARELVKLDKRITKATSEVQSAESHLAYITSEFHALPQQITEQAAELTEKADAASMALAELTKPLDSYASNSPWRSRRYEWGHRKYNSPAAQRAYDTACAEHYARERLDALHADAAKTYTEYTAEARDSLDAARAELQNLDAVRSGYLAQYAAIMGTEPTPEQYQALLIATTAPDAAPVDRIEITARIHNDGKDYVVMAESLIAAFAKVKEVSIEGYIIVTDYIVKWAKLEKGNQINVHWNASLATLELMSPDSKMYLKSQGDHAAPVVQFVTY